MYPIKWLIIVDKVGGIIWLTNVALPWFMSAKV